MLKKYRSFVTLLIAEVALYIVYTHSSIRCEQCIPGAPCPPCISNEQVVAKWLLIILPVTYLVWTFAKYMMPERSLKLIVTEPWSFGDANGVGPFDVTLKKASNEQWLVIFDHDVEYEGIKINCLLAKPNAQYKNVDLVKERYRSLVLEMAYMKGLDQTNFTDYNIDNHRGNFLQGEISNK